MGTQQGSLDVLAMETQIQGLLESLLELGICASEVHPSAIEAHADAPQSNDGASSSGPAAAAATTQNPAGVTAPGGLVGKKVQDTVDAMSSLFRVHRTNPESRDLLIPNEVVDFVDQGRNPEMYTRDLVERVAGENMYTNGIIDSISSYQKYLASEMKLAFPELGEAIEELGILQHANGSSSSDDRGAPTADILQQSHPAKMEE